VLPTLLECAAIPVPHHLQGRSFLPILKQGEEPQGWIPRGSALTEMIGWKTLRTPGFRYVVRKDGAEHLFDLSADPGGYFDVASESTYQRVLASVRQELIHRLIERERLLQPVWPY